MEGGSGGARRRAAPDAALNCRKLRSGPLDLQSLAATHRNGQRAAPVRARSRPRRTRPWRKETVADWRRAPSPSRRRRQHDQRGHAGKPPRGRSDRHGGGNLIGGVASRFLHRPAHRRFGVVASQGQQDGRRQSRSASQWRRGSALCGANRQCRPVRSSESPASLRGCGSPTASARNAPSKRPRWSRRRCRRRAALRRSRAPGAGSKGLCSGRNVARTIVRSGAQAEFRKP